MTTGPAADAPGEGDAVTEAKWLHTDDIVNLLRFVSGPARAGHPGAARKLRLLAVAFCRQVGGHPPHSATRHAVETAEGLADGRATDGDRTDAHTEAHRAYQSLWRAAARPTASLSCCAASMACSAVSHDLGFAVTHTALTWATYHGGPDWGRRLRTAADHLRCIFGNPFRPVTADPRWVTSTVTALARAIYAERAFDRLPILADAIEEAGCDAADLLAHCRSVAPHVRGCWAVDLVLGKQQPTDRPPAASSAGGELRPPDRRR